MRLFVSIGPENPIKGVVNQDIYYIYYYLFI